MKPSVFLTAEWRHLALLNYEVEPALLEPHVPPGLALDFWHGKTYVSLVGFVFRRARLCGIPIPFHRNFPEVNLRFYVKRDLPDGERRGVVFLKEIVPRRAVAWVARTFFGESFVALPMRAAIAADERFAGIPRHVRFEWQFAEDEYSLEVAGSARPHYPPADSLEEFIIDHHWGYSKARRSNGGPAGCTEYAIERPRWMIRPAERALFTGDAAALYGRDFAEVLARPADVAFLVDGAAVRVLRGTRLTESIDAPSPEELLAANVRE
jgi:hypothetical protein